MTMIAPGEYVQIRNMTDIEIDDLCYAYAQHVKLKVRKTASHAKENFMIITTNLQKDHDLIFFFEHDPARTFVFEDAVKKMTCDTTWTYQFYKITEQDGCRMITYDEEGEQEYFAS